jgi:hypothetical protein
MVKSVKALARVLSLVLMSAFMIQLVPVVGFASGDSDAAVVVVIPTDGVFAGDEIDIPIYFSGNPGFAGANLDVFYDQTKFEYVNTVAGPLCAGGFFTPNGATPGMVTVVFFTSTNVNGDGVLFTIKLRALDDIELDDESFGVGYVGKGIANAAGDKVDTTEAVTPPSPMKFYVPVSLTQSGNVDDGDVQYRTAAQIVGALPKTIEVQLDGGIGSASVPITWSSTSVPVYSPNTAGFYTFTSSWGTIPPVANNDNALAAPTCVLEVKQSPPAVGDPITVSSVYGEKTLDQIILTTNPDDESTGTWAWSEANADSIYPTVGMAYQATFTPTDGSAARTRGVTPTVVPKPITISVTPISIKYGQAIPIAFTANDQTGALVGTDTIDELNLTFSTNAPANASVGSYNVMGTANNANYSVTVDGASALTIVQATAQAVATVIADVEKTAYEARSYSDTNAIAAWLFPNTVEVTTDTGSATLPVTWSTTGVYNAKDALYTFTGTLTSNANIAVPVGVSVSVDVTIAPISATNPTFAAAHIVKTENAAMTASDIRAISADLLPASGSTTVEGESVTYAVDWNGGETLDGTAVGANQTFTGTVTYLGAPAWLTISAGSTGSCKITLTDKQVTTVTLADSVNVVYGTAFAAPEASAADGDSVFDYTYSGAANDGTTIYNASEPPFKAGEYTVTATLVSDTHIGNVSKDFSITRKPINAIVTAKSKVYGEAVPQFDAVYTGLVYVDTDAIFDAFTLVTTATSASPVGQYAVTFGDGTTTAQTDNYSVTLDGLDKFSITKKLITVTASDASRAYLEANPEFDFTFDAADLVVGDVKADLAVTLTTAAAVTSNAGDYPVTGTSTSVNYAVIVRQGTLTVTKINQSIPVTVTLSQDTAIYGVTETKIFASVSGGSGTGAYSFASSDINVADINDDGSIVLIGAGKVEIAAYRSGNQNYNDSELSLPVTLTILPKIDLTVGSPIASPVSGTTFSGRLTVTLSTPTEDASIYYTTNGSDPTSEPDSLYTAPITISSTTTIRAIACKSGMNDSDFAAFTYTLRTTGNDPYTPPPTTPPSEEVILDPDTPLAWLNPYSDVADTDWFYEAVCFVTENGLMEGTGANKFSPNITLTRAMIVTILYRLEGKPEVSGDIPFLDVDEGEWYSNAILWASKNNIVFGYGNGKFGLNDPVTREQAVVILYRYAKEKGLDVSMSADLSKFTDMNDVSDWALDAMKWAVAVGIVQGRSDDKMIPGETSTRAEITMIIKRYIEDFLGEGASADT